MHNERLTAVVMGRVQGVGFRYFVSERARQLSLNGFVRNTSEGHVEVVAEGERGRLESLRDSLEHGPRMARVTSVDTAWQAATGEFGRFSIRR